MDEKGNVLKEGSGPYTCFPTPEAVRPRGHRADVPRPGLAGLGRRLHEQEAVQDQSGRGRLHARGDAAGASNTDPYAEAPAHHNQWVVEGPHIMIIVPDPAQLAGLPTTPQTEGAYVMWPGTPYAHVMVPVGQRPAQRMANQ